MTGPATPDAVRAVIDSNVIVRAVLSPTGGAAFLWASLKGRRFTPVTSRHQLAEIYRALSYPRIANKYGVTENARRRTVAQLYCRSTVVSPSHLPALCRDPDDDYLIANALLGGVQYIVTEDKDLLDDPSLVEMLTRRGIKTLRLADFLGVLRAL